MRSAVAPRPRAVVRRNVTARPLLAALAALAAGVLAAPAHAAPVVPPIPPPGFGVAVYQAQLDPSGDPVLTAIAEDRAATVSWYACDPECGAVIGTESLLRPGPTPAGTTFEVRATVAGTPRTARSAPWRGRTASVTPPALAGELRIGRTVTPLAGTWSGGWDAGVDVLDVRACRTADGTDCRTISSPSGGDSLAIDPVYAGWYLGAVDRRYGPDPSLGGVPWLGPTFGALATDPGAVAAPTVALGPLVGPVPAARPGTPPTITGRLAAGVTITATPGTWPDAPDDGLVATGLRACPTPKDDARCRVLARANDDEVATAGRGRATLGTQLLGWYVGAFERHGRSNGFRSSFDPGDPARDALPVAGPTVVVGPLSPTPVRLARTPRVHLRSTAATRGTRLDLGRVRCTGRCVVRLTVSGGGRTVRRVTAARGDAAVTVRRASFPRRTTRLRVRIRVDHSTVDVRRAVRVR
ncbi:hypothetical protein AB0L40_27175 [Patulibacter sp. NPDC049589]|uniref:hypothetical protein n=1 Tax=Patulibacter sp. NPDC049589 TaxID=3154731 RepID=UPI003412F043